MLPVVEEDKCQAEETEWKCSDRFPQEWLFSCKTARDEHRELWPFQFQSQMEMLQAITMSENSERDSCLLDTANADCQFSDGT